MQEIYGRSLMAGMPVSAPRSDTTSLYSDWG
jgi:hypothetical protein